MSLEVKDDIERNGSVERHDAKVGSARIWFYVDHARRLVDISSVRVPAAKRGSGEGRAALAYALGIADKLRYQAQLAASPLDKRTKLDRLVRFYEGQGFERTGESVNPLGHPKMSRAARDARRRRAR